MEQSKSRLSSIAEYATDYVEKKGEIIFLDVVEKSSRVVATIAAGVAIALVGVFFVLFASIWIAWWIAQATGNVAIGFFSITCFYLVLFLITFFSGKNIIQNSLINIIIKKIFYDK